MKVLPQGNAALFQAPGNVVAVIVDFAAAHPMVVEFDEDGEEPVMREAERVGDVAEGTLVGQPDDATLLVQPLRVQSLLDRLRNNAHPPDVDHRSSVLSSRIDIALSRNRPPFAAGSEPPLLWCMKLFLHGAGHDA